jgi:Tol biopolymer transport system component
MFVNTTVPLSASPAGAIAYRSGSAPIERQFSWVDRSGKDMGTVGEPDPYLIAPSSSPDGNFVAFLRRVNGNSDIWTMDTRRGILSRLTEHPREDIFPVWSRDGSRIAFTTNRNGTFDLYEKRVAGGEEQLLVQGVTGETFACDWSPDGRFLLYQRREPRSGWDLIAYPLRGDGKPFAVAQTEADERDGQISPDGQRVAFYSNRAGAFEVYVQPFPGPGAAVQVSANGGAQIRWRPDGRELFYIALDGRMMAVSVQDAANGQLVLGTPAPLFTTRVGRVLRAIGPQYVVAPDGQRFLIANYVQGGPTPIRLILNWHPGQ